MFIYAWLAADNGSTGQHCLRDRFEEYCCKVLISSVAFCVGGQMSRDAHLRSPRSALFSAQCWPSALQCKPPESEPIQLEYVRHIWDRFAKYVPRSDSQTGGGGGGGAAQGEQIWWQQWGRQLGRLLLPACVIACSGLNLGVSCCDYDRG